MLVYLIRRDCLRCNRRFAMCRSCFRNHVYCCNSCSFAARRESKQKWQQAFRRTAEGKEDHRLCERERRRRGNRRKNHRASTDPVGEMDTDLNGPKGGQPAGKKNVDRHTTPAVLVCCTLGMEMRETDSLEGANGENETENELDLGNAGQFFRNVVRLSPGSLARCGHCGVEGIVVTRFPRRATGRSRGCGVVFYQ